MSCGSIFFSMSFRNELTSDVMQGLRLRSIAHIEIETCVSAQFARPR